KRDRMNCEPHEPQRRARRSSRFRENHGPRALICASRWLFAAAAVCGALVANGCKLSSDPAKGCKHCVAPNQCVSGYCVAAAKSGDDGETANPDANSSQSECTQA